VILLRQLRDRHTRQIVQIASVRLIVVKEGIALAPAMRSLSDGLLDGRAGFFA